MEAIPIDSASPRQGSMVTKTRHGVRSFGFLIGHQGTRHGDQMWAHGPRDYFRGRIILPLPAVVVAPKVKRLSHPRTSRGTSRRSNSSRPSLREASFSVELRVK